MYFPVAGVEADPFLLALLGFLLGILGGFFGIGGAFVATPALNLLGFPMPAAIGTNMAHVMGKGIMATLTHWRLRQVDTRAAFWLLLGTAPGVEAGARLVFYLEKLGLADSTVRWVYALTLGGIGWFMLREYREFLRRPEKGEIPFEPLYRRFRLGPYVSLPVSGVSSISVWLLLLTGFGTGFLAGFLGVGGGFIRVPAMIYLLGMPAPVAVGTDLLEIIFSGAYGTITYALKGKVDLLAALILIGGAVVGTQIGAYATLFARYRLRLYLALTILATAVAVVMAELGEKQLSLALLLASTTVMCLVITWVLASGWKKRRRYLALGPHCRPGEGREAAEK